MVNNMKVIVDEDACLGCGLCAGMCDSVFKMNDAGKSEVLKEVEESEEDAVKSAIDSCPVSAISCE